MAELEIERLRAEINALQSRLAESEAGKRDVEAQLAAATDEVARLNKILAHIPLIVDVIDLATWRSIYKNLDLDALLGYPPGALAAMGDKPMMFKVIHPEDIEKMLPRMGRMDLENGRSVSFTFRMRRGDGSYGWFWSESRSFDHDETGKLTRMLTVTHDITKTRLAEDSLRELNEKLDKLVEERTRSLEEANLLLLQEVEARTHLAASAHAQARMIRELSAPIIQVWDDIVAMPLLGALDTERAETMTASLLETISARGVRFCIVDLTAALEMDTSTVELMHRLVQAVTLLGAEVVLTGIRPAVAQTMAEQGIFLQAKTLRNLREALRHCMKRLPRARRV